MQKQAARWPKFAAMYRRACNHAYQARLDAGRESKGWKSGDDMYDWWICDQPADNPDPQLFPMDN
jgi:hypothetical protein